MKISCIVGINALNFELSAIPHSITKLELSKETNKVGRKEYYLKAGVLLEITGDSMGGDSWMPFMSIILHLSYKNSCKMVPQFFGNYFYSFTLL